MLTPAQVRAARGLLNWTRAGLADRSGIGLNTIKAFETGKSNPVMSTLLALEKAFKEAGVVFIDSNRTHGAGLMFRDHPKG